MNPATSIVIPVHNRAALTERCLDLVLADPPMRAEIVVVDDGSTDSTPALLDRYGDAIRRVALPGNSGYATACNAGAAVAGGEVLVFLNNDTEPEPGSLQALARYAESHPAAAAVGAKLLYPTGSIQHAGVVIGQDGYPHNLYAGMPADHPAASCARRLQAVTGACMLVRREAFERVGGFDTGFVNSLEDVDLCLRLGEAGGEVHYCPEAVVVHLESASRGREGRFDRSVALWRERWRDRARRDDVVVYAQDGLLEFEYPESYPLRVGVSPLLAAVDSGREVELDELLDLYARQVSDLLGEVVRLTAAVGLGEAASQRLEAEPGPGSGEFDRREFAREANRLEEEVRALQQRLEEAPPRAGAGLPPRFTASRRLGYRHTVERIRAAVRERVPAGASVLVVSRGDRELVDLDGRRGIHFPHDDDGGYLGYHPHDGADAVARLEAARERGAEYLVLPQPSSWWLAHYAEFAAHLRRYPATELGVCSIFELGAAVAERPVEGARG